MLFASLLQLHGTKLFGFQAFQAFKLYWLSSLPGFQAIYWLSSLSGFQAVLAFRFHWLSSCNGFHGFCCKVVTEFGLCACNVEHKSFCLQFCYKGTECRSVAPMAELRQTWDVKWKDDKWVSFPASMIETFEGKSYLRLRPTCYSLVSLLSKGTASKNASFATSPELAKLVAMRNEAAVKKAYGQADAEQEHDAAAESGAGSDEDNAQPASKKRKVPPGDYTVEINVDDTLIEVLLQGKRPARSDLLVCMEPDQLDCVFGKLALDVEKCLNAEKRLYKARAKQQ